MIPMYHRFHREKYDEQQEFGVAYFRTNSDFTRVSSVGYSTPLTNHETLIIQLKYIH